MCLKAGRSANGKGHYWAIHPANVEDFERGDFRRRRAQRKVRRAMGLSVADEDEDSPIPSPAAAPVAWTHQFRRPEDTVEPSDLRVACTDKAGSVTGPAVRALMPLKHQAAAAATSRKRLFDVESLLAPDTADKPEVVASTTTHAQRRRDDESDHAAVSPEVDDCDVIVDLHRQPIRAAACDDDVTAVSGIQIVGDQLDVMTSANLLPGRQSADSDKTGEGFRYDDVETTSGDGASSNPDVARLWLRHASMASARLANAFFPFSATAYRTLCSTVHSGQGQGEGQGQFEGQSTAECKGLSVSSSMMKDEKNAS